MSTLSEFLILSEGSSPAGYLFYPLLIWLVICAGGIVPLILLRFSDFSPVEHAFPIFQSALSSLDPAWLEESGFQATCAIKPLGISMAFFTNPDRTIVMAVYFVGGARIIDIVSDFPGDISVTTSTSIDGPVVPSPPGVMFQTFRGYEPQDLLQRHQDGIEFLKRHLQIDLVSDKDVASALRQFVGRQLNHLLLRPWNILALPYRWAVTRFARKNLTLEQQEQKGIINLESLKRQSRAVG